MEPSSRIAFFVRLDQIFDLHEPGEYSVQVTRAERLSRGQGTTNVVSGTATFGTVDKLSPSAIAATNALAQNLLETERRARNAWLAAEQRRFLTNKPAVK